MNNLTPAETERLGKFSEEMGESGQVVGKILLHGYHTTHSGIVYNNREDLERECGDVLAAIDLMIKKGDLDKQKVLAFRDAKAAVITKYMNHQDED